MLLLMVFIGSGFALKSSADILLLTMNLLQMLEDREGYGGLSRMG